MELDELKTKWHELDGRLSCADTKIDRLTAEVSAGKIISAKQRLARTIRLGIFLLAVLPLCFANISRTGEADPGTAVKATLALFIFAMLARQIALLVLLALTCVVVFIFSSHWAEISTALAQLSLRQVLLVLAIGLVVDDAIVVVEAVKNHISNGEKPLQATIAAMKEVSGPIVSTALVISLSLIHISEPTRRS